MNHEKIFKKADGSRVRVRLSLNMDSHSYYGKLEVENCLPGKRTFTSVHDGTCSKWRSMDAEQRRINKRETQLLYVTQEELQQVVDELLEEIRKRVLREFD